MNVCFDIMGYSLIRVMWPCQISCTGLLCVHLSLCTYSVLEVSLKKEKTSIFMKSECKLEDLFSVVGFISFYLFNIMASFKNVPF